MTLCNMCYQDNLNLLNIMWFVFKLFYDFFCWKLLKWLVNEVLVLFTFLVPQISSLSTHHHHHHHLKWAVWVHICIHSADFWTVPNMHATIIIIIIINLTLQRTSLTQLHYNSKVHDLSEQPALNKCVFKCLAKVSIPSDKSTISLLPQKLITWTQMSPWSIIYP